MTTPSKLLFSNFLLVAILLSFFAFPSSRFGGGVDASSSVVHVSKFLRRGIIAQKSSTTKASFSLKRWEGTEEYARAEKRAKLLVERVVASSSTTTTSASNKNNNDNRRESKAAATIATHSNTCVAVRERQLCNATGTTQDACDALAQCTWNTWPTDACTNEQADSVRFAISFGYGLSLLLPTLTCAMASFGGESTCNDVDMGCTWKEADNTCEFDLTDESTLTTMFGDSFLSKLMAQSYVCDKYTSADLCTADSSCAWDDTYSWCESRDDLDTSLYSSYCDENTKTQAQNTDFCDVLDVQKTCSAATSENTCSANSECMYGDGDGCSSNLSEAFKMLGITIGATLDSYVDVLTCADVESEAECTSTSTCEVWNSSGEPSSCVPTDAAFDAAFPSNPFLADVTKNGLLCDKYDSETSCQSDGTCAWDCEDSTCVANPNMVEATCTGLTKPYVSEEDVVPVCPAESVFVTGSAAAKGSMKIVFSAVVLVVTALSGLLL
jgi:hypothetical protein